MESNEESRFTYGQKTIALLGVLVVIFAGVMFSISSGKRKAEAKRQNVLYSIITNGVAAQLRGLRPLGFIEPMQMQTRIRPVDSIAFCGWVQVDGGTNGAQTRWFRAYFKESALTNDVPQLGHIQLYSTDPGEN